MAKWRDRDPSWSSWFRSSRKKESYFRYSLRNSLKSVTRKEPGYRWNNNPRSRIYWIRSKLELFIGGSKRPPEMRLRSQANKCSAVFCETCLSVTLFLELLLTFWTLVATGYKKVSCNIHFYLLLILFIESLHFCLPCIWWFTILGLIFL